MITSVQFNAPYDKIKELIRVEGKTQKEIADSLNIDRTTFNMKINRMNGRDFTFEEAMQLSKLLTEKIDNFF